MQVLSAEFYSHSLFTVVVQVKRGFLDPGKSSHNMKTQSGSRLTSLELSSVDEMNLAAVVMIGVNCLGLQHLALSCCHYTQVGKLGAALISELVFPPKEVGDRLRLENLCTEEAKAAPRAPFRQNFLTLVTIVGSGG